MTFCHPESTSFACGFNYKLMRTLELRVSQGGHSPLNRGNFIAIYKEDKLNAAKLKVFNTKTKDHYDYYVTPEVFQSVKEWMDYVVKRRNSIIEESPYRL